MKFGIQVLPKKEVLDSQGRAVEDVFKKEGFQLKSCTVGKYIEIELAESSDDKALQQIKKMSEYVLYNPLIETIQIEKLEVR